jgi:hypothetical protein
MGNQSFHRNDNESITSLRHKMVATSKQKSKQKDPQGNRGKSVQASPSTPERVGRESTRPRELTVVYSPSASASDLNLSGIPAKWRLRSQPSTRRATSHINAFYLTTINDLISDLVALNAPKSYRGILIDASKSSARQRDRLFSLWSQSATGPCTTPYLASKNLRVIRRILEAQRHGDGAAVIADAFAEGRVLVVRDANLEIHRIQVDQHPVLRHLSDQQLLSFRVDSAGSGLHWHELDLDLDLDGLLLRNENTNANYRQQRGAALSAWLEKHPSTFDHLSEEDRSAVRMVTAGKVDLMTSLIDSLAKSAAMSADSLLDDLAAIQRPPAIESPLP